MDKITHILENVVRCKYFEAGVHIKMTQTLDHVVVVHILIWDKRKSQVNKYSDNCVTFVILVLDKVYIHM